MRFADGSIMRLYRQTIEDFGLYAGLEMNEEQMILLRQAADAMSAKMRAVRIVSATSVSKSDLQRRLIQKGESPGYAEEAVAWMENLHLIDDEKTGEQIVRRCIGKGYGLSRAKQILYEKRIPKEYWESLLADYPDQTDAIVAFLQKHLCGGRDEKQLRRAMDALLRRGHSYSEIRRAMEQLGRNSEDFPED